MFRRRSTTTEDAPAEGTPGASETDQAGRTSGAVTAGKGKPTCHYVHLLKEVTDTVAARSCQLAVLVPPATMGRFPRSVMPIRASRA